MLKRFMSLSLVANVLWVGLLVISPRAATAAEFFTEVITCIGFSFFSTTGSMPIEEWAVVYVHNFGSTPATVSVRFAYHNNSAEKVTEKTIDPHTTQDFKITADEACCLGSAGPFLHAQVFPDSKEVESVAEPLPC